MEERRRFTTKKYDREAGGYWVMDRSIRIALFPQQGMAIQYCRMLRAYPQIANGCDACMSYPDWDAALEGE